LPKSTLLFRFDPFEVDATAGQLRKHGLKLRLSGQPLEILIMLLEHPGAVVTREEIRQRLWSSETFVDFENSLNKAINKLRQALSDSSDKPTYIETLPRRGYRFLQPVQRIESQTVSVQPEPFAPATFSSAPIATPNKPPKARALRLTLFVAAALIFLGFSWLFFRPLPAPRILKITPLTTSGRADMFGRLQTDGVRLFFLERRGHRWQLSQMPASGGAVEPFPTSLSNAKILSVSPDASELLLASFTERGRLLALWLMPSVGGTPRRLGDLMATDAVFTPDGARITYANDDGIFEVARDTLNPRKLLGAKGPKQSLSWSPDGRELRFEWITAPQDGATLWSVSSDSRKLHQLFPDWREAPAQCCGRFSPDGRYFFFVGFSPDGSRAVYALREPRGFLFRRSLPQRLDTSPFFLDEPVPGLDGRHLYSLVIDARSEYVRFDPSTHDLHPLLGGASASWLNIAPSLDRGVFRGEGSALFISKLNGSERGELVPASLHPEIPALSPDGKQILFCAKPSGSPFFKISAVSPDGGPVHDLVSESFSVYAPSWSPDSGKFLYAADPDDSTHTGVFVYDCNTKHSRKIPGSEGLWKSRYSPDGKFVVSVSGDNKSVHLFDVSSQKWTVIAQGKVLSPVAWSADSKFLFFQDVLEDDEPVHRYDLQTRKTDLAMECRPLLEGGVLRCGFEDVLPDGSLLLHLTRGDHNVYSLALDLP
jgi:DNA-binding winged helix-turn-helix (wHTH) protein/Tol biopolymer transport system component